MIVVRTVVFTKEDHINKYGPKCRCVVCKEEIQSKHRHDFVICKCEEHDALAAWIAVDGGNDYFKFSGDPSQAEIEIDGVWVSLADHWKR